MIELEREEPLQQQPFPLAAANRETAGITPPGKTPTPILAALAIDIERNGHRHVVTRARQTGEAADQPGEQPGRGGDFRLAGGLDVLRQSVQPAHRLGQMRELCTEDCLKR